MGTLQAEIENTLHQWDIKSPNVIDVRTSKAKQIFTYVKANPSCTSMDIVNATGIDLARTSALLLTMYNKGKLGRKEYPNPDPNGKRYQVFCYWTEVERFEDKGQSRVAKKIKVAPKPNRVLVSTKPFTEAPKEVKVFDPEKFVHGLTLTEIKQLHKFLESYFE